MKSAVMKLVVLAIVVLEVVICPPPPPYFAAINKMFAKKKLKSVDISVKKKSTQSNDKGINLVELKEHNLNCEHGLLSGYKLEKLSPAKYKYHYTCLMPNKCSKECAKKIEDFDKKRCEIKRTNFVKVDTKDQQNTEKLAKLNVACPKYHVLQSFQARSTKDNPPHLYYQ